MGRYLLLMHDDSTEPESSAAWEAYIERLSSSGRLAGGSSLGSAVAHRRSGTPTAASGVVGYVLVEAADHVDAASLLAGNPTYEASGTVHIHELVAD